MTRENENEEETKGMISSGLNSLSNKAKSTAKKGLKSIENKTKDVATKGMKKVGEKAEEVISNAIAYEEANSNKNQNNQASPNRNFGKTMAGTGQNFERQVQTWTGWFWSTIAYGFVIILSFVISSSDSRFTLLPIILLIGFPFFLYYAIINSIPEIKIGNRVIFSRKNLSFQQQLTFTKQVARTFSREMLENSPVGAFFIFAFVILLIFVLIRPFLG